MELSYIREFVVLAETGNYLEAADALFIAQSSLSRHIKSIELDLGSPLFDRTTRKVVLNGFGQAFLPYAKKMVEIQEEYENVLQSYLSGVSSTITVASIPSMVRYNITDVLAGFKQANPRYKLNILEADSSQILQLLWKKNANAALSGTRMDYLTDLTKFHLQQIIWLPYYRRIIRWQTGNICHWKKYRMSRFCF